MSVKNLKNFPRSFALSFTFQSEATGVCCHLLRQQGLEGDVDKQGERENDGWCNWECRHVSDEKFDALVTWAHAAEICGLIRNPIVKKVQA